MLDLLWMIPFPFVLADLGEGAHWGDGRGDIVRDSSCETKLDCSLFSNGTDRPADTVIEAVGEVRNTRMPDLLVGDLIVFAVK